MNYLIITSEKTGASEMFVETSSLAKAIAKRLPQFSVETIHRAALKRPPLIRRSHGNYISEGSVRVVIGDCCRRARLPPNTPALADLVSVTRLIENPHRGMSREYVYNLIHEFDNE